MRPSRITCVVKLPRNHKQQVTQPFLHNTVKEIRRKAFERKWLSERRDEDRRGGEWKLMEKRHEDYYRLISSETDGDDDRKLEGGKREKWREGN